MSFHMPGTWSFRSAEGPTHSRAEGSPVNPESERKSILIVDDEPSILRLFKTILTGALPGIEVDTATNGEEAVQAFLQRRHSVVLMDLHMPVMDGRTAFVKIEEACRAEGWKVPSVIFCTGFVPPQSIKSVVANNPAHGLLTKPVAGHVLVDAVQKRLP